MRQRRVGVLVIATVVAVLLGACGVQSDSEPRKIAAEDVPFDLLAPATSVGPSPGDEGVGRSVWFVDNDGLLARGMRALPTPITPEAVVTALLQGVTDAEANNGLRSNIATGTKLLGVEGPDNGRVTVNLSSDFLKVSRELQRLALAQVVFTLTGLPNVDRVLFEFDGKPTQVPGRGDELTAEPLTRDDFSQFDPSVTTTTVNP
jgi:hypothetical protein